MNMGLVLAFIPKVQYEMSILLLTKTQDSDYK